MRPCRKRLTRLAKIALRRDAHYSPGHLCWKWPHRCHKYPGAQGVSTPSGEVRPTRTARLRQTPRTVARKVDHRNLVRGLMLFHCYMMSRLTYLARILSLLVFLAGTLGTTIALPSIARAEEPHAAMMSKSACLDCGGGKVISDTCSRICPPTLSIELPAVMPIRSTGSSSWMWQDTRLSGRKVPPSPAPPRRL